MHDRTWHSAKTASVDAPSHTWDIFNVEQFRRVVELFEVKLEQINRVHPFNAIAGCGNSGVPLAAALSYTLGIPLITVRKPGEQTVASSQVVTGAYNAGPYIIIDDFSSSGGTVNRMMDAIDRASGGKSVPVAAAFYSHTAYGEMGADTIRWWAKEHRRIPVWGVTQAERTYISRGGAAPEAGVDPAQGDLFQWAQEQQRKAERALELKREKERMVRYELQRARMRERDMMMVSAESPYYSDPWERDMYYMGGYYSRNDMYPDAYEEPKPSSNKPPKYKPPTWATGSSRPRPPKKVPIPRNAR